MRLLYNASNGIEAHLVLNLLEQSGLSVRIDGEYLQGGIGDIQAMGILRVMVEEADYADAMTIINAWDIKSPESVTDGGDVNKLNNIVVGAVGLICGIILTIVFYTLL